ncbi:MAG: hypothetical protein AB1705_07785 [Verrucomicrobiota bacterium]
MKKLMAAGLAGAGLMLGCSREAPPSAPPAAEAPAVQKAEDISLLQLHFIGARHLAGNTNAAKLKELWALPESAALRDQSLDRVAAQLPAWLGAPKEAAAWRPLLADALQNEWVLTAREDAAGAAREWTLAIRLEEARANEWKNALTGGAPGLRVSREQEWVVVGWGGASASDFEKTVARIKAEGRPAKELSESWLELRAHPRFVGLAAGFLRELTDDWLERATGLPRSAERGVKATDATWPEVSLSIVGRGENLHTRSQVRFATPVETPQAWQVPTNTIREPLISFTAYQPASASLQRLAPWLGPHALLPVLGVEPKQLFTWGQAEVMFQIFAAARVEGATNLVRKLGAELPARWNAVLTNQGMGYLQFTNETDLFWRGLVPITPYIQPAPEPGDNFLVAGLFQATPRPNPPPPELLAQLRTNVVYYDWEITEARLRQWRPTLQLLSVQATKGQFFASSSSPAQKWLTALTPRLGNTVTEVTLEGSNELNITRKAHLGLSSIELLALVHWLDNPNFPRTGNPPLKKMNPAEMLPVPAPKK